VAGYAYSNIVFAEPAVHVAHIRVNVPGNGHGLLVRAPAGRAGSDIRGPMEKFKWDISRDSE